MPTMKGTVQEDDYRTEVRFKDKNLFIIKIFLLRFTENPDLQTADPGLRSGPKSGSGAKRWHQSGGRLRGSSLDPARTALPLIRTGTQHTLGPVRISCLGQKDGKENGQFTLKEDSHTKEHIQAKEKRSGLLLLLLLLLLYFCFCFCSTPFFFNGQRHQN
jgi:hypothetical protein